MLTGMNRRAGSLCSEHSLFCSCVSFFLSLAGRCKLLQFLNASRLLASRHRAGKTAKLPLCFHLSQGDCRQSSYTAQVLDSSDVNEYIAEIETRAKMAVWSHICKHRGFQCDTRHSLLPPMQSVVVPVEPAARLRSILGRVTCWLMLCSAKSRRMCPLHCSKGATESVSIICLTHSSPPRPSVGTISLSGCPWRNICLFVER